MGGKLKDLTGQTFGRLTVLYRGPDYLKNSGRKEVTWICQCSCGNPELKTVAANHLGRTTQSCGCYGKEKSKEGYPVHGQSGTRTYRIYHGMLQRCGNENTARYSDYGGRGITVCDRWKENYMHFVEDMGVCPPKHSIERVDNNKGYEPGNCQWATTKEQSRNRRSNRHVYVKGRRWILADLAIEFSLNIMTLHSRLSRGLSEEELVAPVTRGGRKERNK